MTHAFMKYPRTSHIQGSRIQKGDEDMECVPFSRIVGRNLVVEEKMDGANCAVSFGSGGEILLQSRGHYLTGGPRERHFNLLKQWAACHESGFREVLSDRYIMFGEWLYAKHTIFYDRLPHYFLEFDLFDRVANEFLSTPRRKELLKDCPVRSVPILCERVLSERENLEDLVGISSAATSFNMEAFLESCREAAADSEIALRQTDMSGLMEGLYIKVEEDGVVKERYKWVRAEFLQAVDQSGSHWLSRPIVPNRLLHGVDIFAP